jgi:hypothetical protein
LDEEDPADLFCVDGAGGIACTNTQSADTLMETQDISKVLGSNPPIRFDFGIQCQGTDCWKRDIYYHIKLRKVRYITYPVV